MTQITRFLNNCFGSKKVSLKDLSYFLCKTAKGNSYVETLGRHADSLHAWIKSSYEEDFQEAFFSEITHSIRKMRITIANLAIDVTTDPFYGKTRSFHIINCKKERGFSAKFHFINCHLVNNGKQIPIMCLPIRLGNFASQTIRLISLCRKLFSRIRCITFDRGFYCAEIIQHLESLDIKYQIFVPKKQGVLSEHLENTKEFDFFQHEMILNKNKTKTKVYTNIFACKNVCDKDWLFATNIPFSSKTECVSSYKKRWQIETNFRVEDEAKIKSKSCNILIRYFYHICSSLLRLFWILSKQTKPSVPFKKFLDNLEQELFFEMYEIRRL